MTFMYKWELLAPTPAQAMKGSPILSAGWRMSVLGTLSAASECMLQIQWYTWWSSSAVLVFRNVRHK